MSTFDIVTAKEIWTILNQLTPLEEARAYQSIFAKGEVKVKSESLQRPLYRRVGSLPSWAAEGIFAMPVEQLDNWLDAVPDVENLEDLIGPAPSVGRGHRGVYTERPG